MMETNLKTREVERNGKNEINPRSVTFQVSKNEPFHSWYPYLEGYSADFVRGVIKEYMPDARTILDPFAGTVMTGFTASEFGIRSFYCEINPVMQFIANVKIKLRSLDFSERKQICEKIDEISRDIGNSIKNSQPDKLLEKAYYDVFNSSVYFPSDNFKKILSSKTLIDDIKVESDLLSDILRVAVVSSLINSSYTKRAGDLRFKTQKELEKGVPDFVDVLQRKLNEIKTDMLRLYPSLKIVPTLICESAFNLNKIPSLKIDGLITSPPYINGTNYFRNTKLELWFLGCLRQKEDLKYYRELTVTAGINDVNGKCKLSEIESVVAVVNELEKKAYDKRIPKMVSSYFYELEQIFSHIMSHIIEGGVIAIDIGDSQYAKVHIPTDKLLIDVMKHIGYKYKKTVELRDRYSKDRSKLKQVLLVFER